MNDSATKNTHSAHVRCISDPEDPLLPKICDFSNWIFLADPSSHYAKLDEWKRRIKQMNGRIYFILNMEPTKGPVGVQAFLFVHWKEYHGKALRELPNVSSPVSSSHIWLCGTDPTVRQKGFMRQLFSRAEADWIQAIPNVLHIIPVMSVNTVPESYPQMVKYLERLGFCREEHLEQDSKIGFYRLIQPGGADAAGRETSH
ncbi:hypothetical protein DFS34DRAFT_598093 [Phlyctochytrium arcticum]|nr:hypothetical protein DFS34DRAFT_598093 [Phlyctochytrium arcticum]